MIQKCKYRFSGECFRRFLQHHQLTYLAAAKELDLDKNTVGKLARSGNTTIAIMLRIANFYGIPIEDFFILDNRSCSANEKMGKYYVCDHSSDCSPEQLCNTEGGAPLPSIRDYLTLTELRFAGITAQLDCIEQLIRERNTY